jgi:7,8-dihydropterin-6-yl-methyl-4-(beta-D-ribofuranosyl)aminobenzene 5'-phosphate synthase
MNVSTLIENRAKAGEAALVSEWGLSLHIAVNGRAILFDTGASGAFADNAEQMGVDLAGVDAAVLSHHHYDHGGGLHRFFALNTQAPVFAAGPPHGACTVRVQAGQATFIGIDRAVFEDHATRFRTVRRTVEILPDVFVIPKITDRHPMPDGNRQLHVKQGGQVMPDDFSHELVMVVKERGQLVVFTGCAHNGVLNMLDTVAGAFGGTPIKAVIGGFHLTDAALSNVGSGGRQAIAALGQAIMDIPVAVAYTGHCTGDRSFAILKSVMGERLRGLHTGRCFEM